MRVHTRVTYRVCNWSSVLTPWSSLPRDPWSSPSCPYIHRFLTPSPLLALSLQANKLSSNALSGLSVSGYGSKMLYINPNSQFPRLAFDVQCHAEPPEVVNRAELKQSKETRFGGRVVQRTTLVVDKTADDGEIEVGISVGGSEPAFVWRESGNPTEIRTLIFPSSAVELNTTSALANYANEAGLSWYRVNRVSATYLDTDLTMRLGLLSSQLRDLTKRELPCRSLSCHNELCEVNGTSNLEFNEDSLNGMSNSPMASLVLTDSSQLTSDSQQLGSVGVVGKEGMVDQGAQALEIQTLFFGKYLYHQVVIYSLLGEELMRGLRRDSTKAHRSGRGTEGFSLSQPTLFTYLGETVRYSPFSGKPNSSEGSGFLPPPPAPAPALSCKDPYKKYYIWLLQKPNRDSNLNLPAIRSLVYCEGSALDHVATEVDNILILKGLAGQEEGFGYSWVLSSVGDFENLSGRREDKVFSHQTETVEEHSSIRAATLIKYHLTKHGDYQSP
uniref:Uncharacterized protein n=1 Tax=Timema bartmani TaxID=61472 RepID=A0A7R9EV19_9NEOP|nr:unnamed protein product [Timema bartmani]